MRHLLFTLAQALGLVVLADFVAGVVHWLEDAYATADTPVVGPLLIRPNIVHHHYPRFFTRLSWWQSSWDLLLLGLAALGLGGWLGFLSWQLGLFVLISVNANQVHKWSHRTRAENGRVISFLQDLRVLQTPRHHALHHTDPNNTFYCPITNLVNPLLERIRFWSRVEWLIERATGLAHRRDTSNRGQGPGPAWLSDYQPKPAPKTPPASACALGDCIGCARASFCSRAPRTRDLP